MTLVELLLQLAALPEAAEHGEDVKGATDQIEKADFLQAR